MGEYKFNLSQSTHKVTLKHTSYEFKLQHVGRRGPKGDTGPSAVWGDIDGNIVNQSDLQAALALKADLDSLAPVALSGDYNDLNNLPSLNFLPLSGGTVTGDLTVSGAVDINGLTANNGGFAIGESSAIPDSTLGGMDAPFGTISGNDAVMRIITWHGYQQYVSKRGPAEWYISHTNGTNETNIMSAYYNRVEIKNGYLSVAGNLVLDDPASSATITFDYSSGVPRIFSGGANNMYLGDTGGYLDFAPAAASGSAKFTYNRITGTSGSLFRLTAAALTGASSSESARQYGLKIDPTINQSGGAHSSMLLIDPVITALGAGVHYLIDARAGGTQRFSVDHNGSAVLNNSSGDALRLNGTGTNSTLLRLLDDGTERGAIFSTNGSSILHLRSQGELRLTSNNGGTAQHITMSGGTVDVGSQTIRGSAITLGPEADTFQTVLTVRRNAIDVGRIDNNGSGFRLQSLTNLLQLRASDNMGIDISATSISLANKATGFFGATPVAKPTGVAVSAAGIHAALVSLGLISS